MEERLLLFTVAGERFALNLQEVAEVMEPPASYPVPRVPGHFVGLINFHGALTALVDLALYTGRGSRRPGRGKVLVLDPHLAGLALWVEEVGLVLAGAAILSREPGQDPLTAELLQTESGRVRLLGVEALLFALERELR